MINCDKFVFLDNVPFTKNGLQNRNRIKTSAGVSWLTVPVLQKGLFGQLTNDVKINNDVDWRKKNWNSVYMSYCKAPFFSDYSDFFENVYKFEWSNLVELNLEFLKFIMAELGINIPTCLASELNCSGKGSELLLNICKKLSATVYLSGVSGKKYLKEGEFKDNHIELRYHEFVHPVYDQLYGEFIPNLSIIDLMFNHGKKSIDIISGKGNIV